MGETSDSNMMSEGWMQNCIIELEQTMNAAVQQNNLLLGEMARLKNQQQSVGQDGSNLQKMIKTCKVEAFRGDRAMGVLEGWIYRMEVHMSYFPTTNDEEKGKFVRSFFMDTASTWVQTWEKDQERQGIPLFWSRLKQGLLQQFQAVDSLTTARMKLWDLNQTGDIQHYIDEF